MRLSVQSLTASIALVATLLLVACETPMPGNIYPELSYSHLPPLKFQVAEIEVRDDYIPLTAPPNVEVLFPVRPSKAAVNWARDRLVATGSTRRLRFVVKEASVVETPLDVKSGLEGAVTTDQSERYDARLVIEVQVVDDTGRVEGTASARAVRSVTVAEDASLFEREQVWYELTEKIMQDMNEQLETTLKQVFFRFMEI
jgi:hypothetical protein